MATSKKAEKYVYFFGGGKADGVAGRGAGTVAYAASGVAGSRCVGSICSARTSTWPALGLRTTSTSGASTAPRLSGARASAARRSQPSASVVTGSEALPRLRVSSSGSGGPSLRRRGRAIAHGVLGPVPKVMSRGTHDSARSRRCSGPLLGREFEALLDWAETLQRERPRVGGLPGAFGT